MLKFLKKNRVDEIMRERILTSIKEDIQDGKIKDILE